MNGKVFDVEVDQSGPVVQSVQHTSPVPGPASVAASVAPPPVASSPVPRPGPGESDPGLMKSPLPGRILKVHAAPGKRFKRGDTLLIIEAMKMENEILAPRDCVVAEVFVAADQSIRTGEPLLRLA